MPRWSATCTLKPCSPAVPNGQCEQTKAKWRLESNWWHFTCSTTVGLLSLAKSQLSHVYKTNCSEEGFGWYSFSCVESGSVAHLTSVWTVTFRSKPWWTELEWRRIVCLIFDFIGQYEQQMRVTMPDSMCQKYDDRSANFFWQAKQVYKPSLGWNVKLCILNSVQIFDTYSQPSNVHLNSLLTRCILSKWFLSIVLFSKQTSHWTQR